MESSLSELLLPCSGPLKHAHPFVDGSSIFTEPLLRLCRCDGLYSGSPKSHRPGYLLLYRMDLPHEINNLPVRSRSFPPELPDSVISVTSSTTSGMLVVVRCPIKRKDVTAHLESRRAEFYEVFPIVMPKYAGGSQLNRPYDSVENHGRLQVTEGNQLRQLRYIHSFQPQPMGWNSCFGALAPLVTGFFTQFELDASSLRWSASLGYRSHISNQRA